MAAYMAIQAKVALEAFRSSDFAGAAGSLRDQGAFAEGHMANWIPVFAKAVRNSRAAESAVMYPQMIEALGAFVAADVAFTVEASYWLEGLSIAAITQKSLKNDTSLSDRKDVLSDEDEN